MFLVEDKNLQLWLEREWPALWCWVKQTCPLNTNIFIPYFAIERYRTVRYCKWKQDMLKAGGA